MDPKDLIKDKDLFNSIYQMSPEELNDLQEKLVKQIEKGKETLEKSFQQMSDSIVSHINQTKEINKQLEKANQELIINKMNLQITLSKIQENNKIISKKLNKKEINLDIDEFWKNL